MKKTCPTCKQPHQKKGIYCGNTCSYAARKGRPKSAEMKAKMSIAIAGNSIPVQLGNRFTSLVVVGQPFIHNRRTRVSVRCDCGQEFEVQVNSLRTGNTTSCGCNRLQLLKERNETHGLAPRSGRHPLYRTWAGIIQRCTNLNNPKYADYGGRGITVCERWKNSFQDFLSDVGERPNPKLELDRVNNNEGYYPGNVRWATRAQQNRNTRIAMLYELGGQRLAISEWAEQLGWSVEGMRHRIKRLPLEEALIQKPSEEIV